AAACDVSPPLGSLGDRETADAGSGWGHTDHACDNGCGTSPQGGPRADAAAAPSPPVSPAGAAVEQKSPGKRPPAVLVESFDGLGVGFEGPQGPSTGRNPSDNSLAVGPDHIVQIVNSRLAVFTKKGTLYHTTGKVLYGAVN